MINRRFGMPIVLHFYSRSWSCRLLSGGMPFKYALLAGRRPVTRLLAIGLPS